MKPRDKGGVLSEALYQWQLPRKQQESIQKLHAFIKETLAEKEPPIESKITEKAKRKTTDEKLKTKTVTPETKPTSESESKIPAPIPRETAATTIQHFWRRYQLKKQFFSPKNEEKYWHMLDEQQREHKLLAKLMFGKTVAGLRDDKRNEYLFPARQNPDWKLAEAFYHRDDPLKGIPLINSITSYFVESPDPKKNVYLPITVLHNFSIDDFMNKFLTKEERLLVTIHKKEGKNNLINIIQIAQKGQDSENVYLKLRSAGLIASPWEIAKFQEKIATESEEKKEVKSKEREPTSSTITVAELNKSSAMEKLKKITTDPKSPIQKLATCLYQMLNNLPNNDTFDPNILQSIAMFLDIAVTFHKKDYERFAFSFYMITHELTLLLNDALEKGTTLITYDEFKKSTDKNDNRHFGLPIPTDSPAKYSTIAAPAMAGTHSFFVALNLAKKMQTKNEGPSIKIIEPAYFEFNKFFPEQKETKDELADIYLLSVGPIASPKEGITPGTDINKFVRNQLLRGKKELSKPITLVVDVTTGLDKNLKLDANIQQLVANGQLSIICYESYQKFGLAHTDQAQAGVVYGICSNSSFSNENLTQFAINAEADLSTHIDMIVSSYIHMHSQDYLERIKEQHFQSGAIFRQFFTKSKDYSLKEKYYDDMLSNLNELYFFILTGNKKMNVSSASMFTTRDSFGHFTTTLSPLGGIERLSPGASDKIDTLIQVSQMYLATDFDREDLFQLLERLLKDKDKPNLEQEIVLTSVLMAIKNLSREPKLSLAEEFTLCRGIKMLFDNASKEMYGRTSFQTLIGHLRSSDAKQNQDFINRSSITAFLFSNSPDLKPSSPTSQDIEVVEKQLKQLKQLSELKDEKSEKSLEKSQQPRAIIALYFSRIWSSTDPAFQNVIKQCKNPYFSKAINILVENNLLNANIMYILSNPKNDTIQIAKEIAQSKKADLPKVMESLLGTTQYSPPSGKDSTM